MPGLEEERYLGCGEPSFRSLGAQITNYIF
jgi:hypothetical protein